MVLKIIFMTSLTKEEIENYEKNGYLIKRQFYDSDEITKIRNWVYGYTKKKQEDWEAGKEMAYYETSKNDNSRVLSRVENFLQYHEGFKELVESTRIKNCMEDLLKEPAVIFKEKINFKKPGAGGFRPHQDQGARWETFAKKFMSILICTDDCTVENGCLEVAPGFHKKGLLNEVDTPIPEKWTSQMNFVPFLSKVGDVVFFDGCTPHQSQINNSEHSRTNIYLTYNGISEGEHRQEYLTRKRKELPPDNERGSDYKDSPIHDWK
jgi:ectoine hydroxylase-related dioxygenase (phytanoyl-CoA dioxygenase family)